jgi:hypothetical protein
VSASGYYIYEAMDKHREIVGLVEMILRYRVLEKEE